MTSTKKCECTIRSQLIQVHTRRKYFFKKILVLYFHLLVINQKDGNLNSLGQKFVLIFRLRHVAVMLCLLRPYKFEKYLLM